MKSVKVSGYFVLFLGVGLLLVTFIVAFSSIQVNVIISSPERAISEALASLLSACIKAMFLGVMGWVGSILTLRGVALLKETPKEPDQKKVEVKAQPESV
jgi:hypothetical protein